MKTHADKTDSSRGFSVSRWFAIARKEFIQLKRDRPTLGMIVAIPLLQMFLFGFAINTDPKHLPTAIVYDDQSIFTRSFIAAMKNTEYFTFVDKAWDERSAKEALTTGTVQFVLTIPVDFTRKLLRGKHPDLLIEADATDPTAIGNAAAAVGSLAGTVIQRDLPGTAQVPSSGKSTSYGVVLHKLYNPEGITTYNVIPGLMGLILTMTLVMMTAVAITRERERGTMENLLAMPTKPFEVISGKLVPYIFIGLIQSSIIIVATRFLFHIPFQGSLTLLFIMILLFIAGNLALGITLSSFARNQMQAMQMSMFTILPSLLLSGFLFPFKGMPVWAQAMGSVVPLTYFTRVVRGIMLKGSGWTELWPNIWPLLLFNLVVLTVGIKFYRKTLD